MNFGPCAHVDAAGRLVENEHFRLRREPPRDDDFLLIAAAQAPNSSLGAGRLDREIANGALRERFPAAAADEGQSLMEDDRLQIG